MDGYNVDAETTYFDGPDEQWWSYRSGLVRRFSQWQQEHSQHQDLLQEAGRLFPPRGLISEKLAASASWRPCESGVASSRAVLVNAGGVYGGDDGPSGLWHFLSKERSADMSFLLLDTGHSLGVAVAVLRNALHWLLDAHPDVTGRIILAGFSMGSAVVAAVLPAFADALLGVVLVAGQTSGTEGIAHLGPRPVLIVQGSADPMVSPECAPALAARCERAGADVRLEVLEQGAARGSDEEDGSRRMKLHHLRDERWQLHGIVVSWLGEVIDQERPPVTVVAGLASGQPNSDELIASLLQAASAAQADVGEVDHRLAEQAGR